jgi:hypothetical protein
MKLEDLKKQELIDLVRELKLELDKKVDVVETAAGKAAELPFQSKSIFSHNGKIKVATIAFNPLTKEAQVLPDLREYSATQIHMAMYEVKKHLVETSMKQILKEEK